MRITAIRERTVSTAAPVKNASIGFSEMTASALVIETDAVRHGKPVKGLAFDSIGRYGHGGLLRERFIPRLLAARPEEYADEARGGIDPFKVFAIVMRNEKPGGHGERPGAVGLIDAAVWDIAAKLEDKPLWALLAERFGGGQAVRHVPVYASGGHYGAGDDRAALQDEIRRARELGFTRYKIKFGGVPADRDLRRVEAALAVLGPGSDLALDCNGSLSLDRALDLAASLVERGIAWLEEPFDPLDYERHRQFTAASPLPLGTGENIFSAADVRNLLRYAGLRGGRDLLQMDVSLSYGIVEYMEMLAAIEAHGFSRRQCVPHAGHLLALNVVAGLGLGGHEMSPHGSFALPVESGFVAVSDAPGVGYEAVPASLALFDGLLSEEKGA